MRSRPAPESGFVVLPTCPGGSGSPATRPSRRTVPRRRHSPTRLQRHNATPTSQANASHRDIAVPRIDLNVPHAVADARTAPLRHRQENMHTIARHGTLHHERLTPARVDDLLRPHGHPSARNAVIQVDAPHTIAKNEPQPGAHPRTRSRLIRRPRQRIDDRSRATQHRPGHLPLIMPEPPGTPSHLNGEPRAPAAPIRPLLAGATTEPRRPRHRHGEPVATLRARPVHGAQHTGALRQKQR